MSNAPLYAIGNLPILSTKFAESSQKGDSELPVTLYVTLNFRNYTQEGPTLITSPLAEEGALRRLLWTYSGGTRDLGKPPKWLSL